MEILLEDVLSLFNNFIKILGCTSILIELRHFLWSEKIIFIPYNSSHNNKSSL